MEPLTLANGYRQGQGTIDIPFSIGFLEGVLLLGDLPVPPVVLELVREEEVEHLYRIINR